MGYRVRHHKLNIIQARSSLWSAAGLLASHRPPAVSGRIEPQQVLPIVTQFSD